MQKITSYYQGKLQGVCIGGLIFWLASPCFSTQGIYDGAPNMWVENDEILCLGAKEFKVHSFIFDRTVEIDDGEVVIFTVGLYKEGEGYYWKSSVNNYDYSYGFSINSKTCIKYGQTIPNFEVSVFPRAITNGVYTLTLNGVDIRNDYRAFFGGKYVCIESKGKKLSLKGAVLDKKTSKWVCAD